MAESLVPSGVQPQVKSICAEVVKANPQVTHVYGYHTIPDHNNRLCIDYMIKSIADGDKVVDYHLRDRARLLVDIIIFNRQIIRSYDKTQNGKLYKAWTPAPYTPAENPKWTNPHTDHPHVQYKEGSYVPPTSSIPNPKNAAGIKKGDKVETTANLNARSSPGGPVTMEGGKPLVRPKGYQFTVTGDPVNGWITGGKNWYSSDYLKKVSTTPTTPSKPPTQPSKPTWNLVTTLQTKSMPGTVTYLQDVAWVPPQEGYAACWVMAQAVNSDKDTRFVLFRENGTYVSTMTVKGGGHGSSFTAYRSAAGNLWIWTWIKEVAHRVKWQSGKTVSTGVRDDYNGMRPLAAPLPFVGMRKGYSSTEKITLHDRIKFSEGNRSPMKSVTLRKRAGATQQTWAASAFRVYRLTGKTNSPAGAGSGKHLLEVFDWNAKLLQTVDLTDMMVSSTSDEPEGLTFDKAANLLVGKREGGSKPNRSYPIWRVTGLK